MKYKKIICTVLIVCAIVLSLAGCAPEFEGSSVKNSDSYTLDIESMNGKDSHTMELERGNVLRIDFETAKGSLSMEIQAPDGSAVYRGDGTEVTEFTLTVPMDGVYSIIVEGDRAKGRISVNAEKAPH